MEPTRDQLNEIISICLLALQEEQDQRERRSKRKSRNVFIASQVSLSVVCAMVAHFAIKRGKTILFNVTTGIFYIAAATLIPTVGIAAYMHYKNSRNIHRILPSTSACERTKYEDIQGHTSHEMRENNTAQLRLELSEMFERKKIGSRPMSPKMHEGNPGKLLLELSKIFEREKIGTRPMSPKMREDNPGKLLVGLSQMFERKMIGIRRETNADTAATDTNQLPNYGSPSDESRGSSSFVPSAYPSKERGEGGAALFGDRLILYGTWENDVVPGTSRGKTRESKKYFCTKTSAMKGTNDKKERCR